MEERGKRRTHGRAVREDEIEEISHLEA